MLGLDTVDPECFTMEVLYSAMEQTGQFSCSDPMVNRLFLNALWGQKSNFVDNPTDCPQRDERMGWTGDAQVFAPTACLNMNAQQFFHKYLYDLACEQKKTGFVPVTVPNILFKTNMWGIPTTGWSDAAVLIPWTLYLHYGDLDILAQQYESMTAWVDYMTAQDKDGTHLYGGFHLGDWLAQDTKDPNNLFGLTPTGSSPPPSMPTPPRLPDTPRTCWARKRMPVPMRNWPPRSGKPSAGSMSPPAAGSFLKRRRPMSSR